MEPSRHAGGTTPDVLDREAALARVDGDLGMLASLVEIMLTELTEMTNTLREALKAGNAQALEHAAHRLKGSVSIFGATLATETALQLEKIGRSGDLRDAARVWTVLEKQLQLMKPALLDLRRELPH